MIYINKASTIADALAIKKPGIENFKIISQLVDDIVTVSDNDIIRAMLLTLEKTKLIVEASGALGLAAILTGKINITKGNTVVILSGGNIDESSIPLLIKKGLSLEKRYITLEGLIPNDPDYMKKIIDIISSSGIDIISINYDRSTTLIPSGYINIIIKLKASSYKIINELINKMKKLGLILKNFN